MCQEKDDGCYYYILAYFTTLPAGQLPRAPAHSLSTALGHPAPEREKPVGRHESDADSALSRKKVQVVLELSSHHAYCPCTRIRRSWLYTSTNSTGRSNVRVCNFETAYY